jgi:hypothetical protein
MKRRQDFLYRQKGKSSTPTALLIKTAPLSATLKEERIRERKDIAGMGGNGGGKKSMFFFTYSCSGGFKKNLT